MTRRRRQSFIENFVHLPQKIDLTQPIPQTRAFGHSFGIPTGVFAHFLHRCALAFEFAKLGGVPSGGFDFLHLIQASGNLTSASVVPAKRWSL